MPNNFMTRRAPARANSYDPETRTFEAVIATATPVERRDYEGAYAEVLDLSGDLPGSLPLLNGHRQSSTSDVIGKITALRRDGNEIVASVKLSSRSEVEGIAKDIADGILDSFSVGYRIKDARDETINGKRSKIVTPEFLEASIVPVPADANAKLRGKDMPQTRAATEARIRSIAELGGLDDAWIEDAIERGLSEKEARAEALEAMEQRSEPARTIRTGHNDRTLENPEARRSAMAEAFSARMTGASPSDAAREFITDGYRSFADVARETLERSGARVTGLRPLELIQRAYTTTSDFPLFLQGVGNRTLLPRFQAVLSPVVGLARRKTAADFRAFSELRLGTGMRLEPLNEAGEMKAGSFVESKESMKIASYGKTFSISFHALANDDLGVFSQVTSDLATSAANTASDLVIDLIKANPKLGDGKAVFHADHSNLSGAGSALSETSIQTALLAMRKQRGIAGEHIRVEPSTLVVAPELEWTAKKLLATISPTKTSDANPLSGQFTLMIEPRFEGNGWFLVDPSLGDLVDAYLSGFEGPQVETRQGWETLGSEWRCHMHYGSAFMGFRGWHKATGAA